MAVSCLIYSLISNSNCSNGGPLWGPLKKRNQEDMPSLSPHGVTHTYELHTHNTHMQAGAVGGRCRLVQALVDP